jgi:membrane associated rhomboid family serine protease
MASIIDELKQTYKQGSTLIKLIFINVAVFLVFRILYLILYLTGSTALFQSAYWLSVPSFIPGLILKPWTLITYMFYHEDIWHIFFNMLWLYWFGKLFLQFFDDRKLVSLYIIGGIAGALLYVLAYNAIPVFNINSSGSILLGASAGVMAIVFAVSFYAPDYKILLMFFGETKIVYVALVSLVLDLIMITSNNSGGHIAHLGGAFIGYLWAVRYRKGKDFTYGLSKFLDKLFNLFKFKPKLKVKYKRPTDDFEYNRSKAEYQNEIDRILDKISKGGYDSLSKQEKDMLFKMKDHK